MFQIHEECAANVRVLSLSGKLDYYGVKDFKSALEKEAIKHIVLDLTQVPFINSEFLGILVTNQQRYAKTDKTISLVVDPESVVGQVFNNASIQKLMPIFHSKKEALSSFLATPSC
jgi:anti-anti-sigma factor